MNEWEMKEAERTLEADMNISEPADQRIIRTVSCFNKLTFIISGLHVAFRRFQELL